MTIIIVCTISAIAATDFMFSIGRRDAAAWGRVLAEGNGTVGFMTVAHPDLFDGVQVLRVTCRFFEFFLVG